MSVQSSPGPRENARVPARIKQRARPYLLLLDADLRIVHYENAALTLLADVCGPAPEARLPRVVEQSVTAAVARGLDRADHHATIMPAPSLIVHIPLASAARRFALTKREREVLQLIMRGLQAPDIAADLSISQSTVTGYFKVLLRKTESRNRSEMVAKVLGWDENDILYASR